MLATHILIDSHQKKGYVKPLWRRVSPALLQHLTTVEVSWTNPTWRIESAFSDLIWDGWRKIIVIGTTESILQSVNALMRFPKETRKQVKLGLWPIELRDYLFLHDSRSILRIAEIFKQGMTCPVDLGKMQWLSPHHQKQSLYFWNQIRIKNEFSEKFDLCVDAKRYPQMQEEYCTVRLHQEGLHSIHITPSTLRGMEPLHLSFVLPWLAPLTKIEPFAYQKFFIHPERECEWIHLQTVNQHRALWIREMNQKSSFVSFSIVNDAFPLIVSSVPVRSRKKISSMILSARKRSVPNPLSHSKDSS